MKIGRVVFGLCALTVMLGLRARASCVCYYISTATFDCENDQGTCHRKVMVNVCNGYPNSCTYCDDLKSYKFCCGDLFGNAGPGGPCTGSPQISEVLAGEQSASESLSVDVPSCAGGLIAATALGGSGEVR